MIKETISYNDFNGNPRTEDFYFNLTKAEIMRMEMSTQGGLAERINRIIAAQDTPAIIAIFEDLSADSPNVMSGYLFEMDSSPIYQGGPYRDGKIILNYEEWIIKLFDSGEEFEGSTNDEGTRDLLISIKNDDLSVEQRAFAEKYMQNLFKILYYATQQGIYYEFDANFDLVEVKNTDSKTTLCKVFDLDSWVRMYIHSELLRNNDQNKKIYPKRKRRITGAKPSGFTLNSTEPVTYAIRNAKAYIATPTNTPTRYSPMAFPLRSPIDAILLFSNFVQ